MDKLRVLGLSIIGTLLLLAFLGPVLSQHDPLAVNLVIQPLPPSMNHFFGTDQLGRDLFIRSIFALKESCQTAFLATLFIILIGTFLGVLAGYFGGVIDTIVVGLIDAMLAFPSLLLTIAVCAVLGGGSITILISLVVSGWASTARISRATVQTIKSKEFVVSTRLLGAGHIYILMRHILPHCIPVLSVVSVMTLSSVFLSEASLSFLGFGSPPPFPSLGKLIYEGARYFRIAPWWSFFPGLLIALIILSLNLISDSLRRQAQLKETL